MGLVRVLVVLVVVGSVLAPVSGVGSGDVAAAQTAEDLCDAGSAVGFSDVGVGDYAAEYVLCMRVLGLSVGGRDGGYGPDAELTRGQMASFLVRLWRDVLGRGCPDDVVLPFVDVAGTTHETNIGCLYGLGLAMGTTTTTYAPGDKLKASQISRFLLRVYEKTGDRCDAAGGELERALECLVGLRVIPSGAEGGDDGSVVRAQMAVYVVGLWHNVSGRGVPPPPPAKGTSTAAGGTQPEPTTPSEPPPGTNPPQTTSITISAGDYHSCVVRSDGSVVCWGNNEDGRATPPAGSFTAVSAASRHSCALGTAGSVVCWGWSGRATPPSGSFTAVSHSCALGTDGSVVCWGLVTTPPSGSFTAVSTGGLHSCGVRDDGSVACWGSNRNAQATPPAGSFTAVSAGGFHSCGVRDDGSVVCWGSDTWGVATPPSGSFTAVSAGAAHSCGVRDDGSVVCWGNNVYGQATPPAGSFTAVSVGVFHSCALGTDGSVVCWGNNEHGQATPPDELEVPPEE